ncbi:MAG: TIGR01777 family oxidoreductase [Planctomycetota bacterium]
MQVFITGASGMVGTALQASLLAAGHQPVALARSSDPHDAPCWDPETGIIHADRTKAWDAVVHLAGDNIGAGRWTAEKKRRIVESRVGPTEKLARFLASLNQPPQVFLSASAVGIFGDRGEEVLTEESPLGEGFVPETCAAWEGATTSAAEAGVRVAIARIGVVVDPSGGALAKMLQPFRLGLGGVTGSGRQRMSWIGLEDTVRALRFLLETPTLAGPIHLSAPGVVDARTFTKTLGQALHRPTILPVPSFVIRFLFGEMGQVLVLEGAHVAPQRLLDAGFEFRHPQLAPLLQELLG